MSHPKVSVIIPVYKVERFIEKCARSLFEQTLEEIEYIFVNDCTPDHSMEILSKVLEEYPRRKNQIKIINHAQNLGVSKSRQDGHNFATGEYVIHCDADDWVDLNMYEYMYNEGEKTEADIVCCEFYIEYSSGRRKKSTKFEYDFETKENMKFNISPLYGSLCNKLIKKEIYDDHKITFFKDVNMGEDLGVSLQCRYYSRKTVIIHQHFYHYNVTNENSTYTTFTDAKSNQIIACVQNLEDFIKNQPDYDLFKNRLLYLKFQSKYELINNPKIRNIRKWKTIFPETHQYIFKFKEGPFNLRIISWLLSHNMGKFAKLLLEIKPFISRIKKIK